MMAFSLTPRQLMQAKEAIEMLSNLSREDPSTSESGLQVAASTNTQAVAHEAIPPSRRSQQPSSICSSSNNTVSSSEAREVLSAASRCLISMNHLKSAESMSGRRRKAKEEVSSLFVKKRKGVAKCVWKHKFICLADCKQKRIPTTDAEKDQLLMAGLGEKEIEFFDLELSAAEFRDLLYRHFPTLQEGGGYQFFKCVANSRYLEQLSTTTLSSPAMLKSRVGNARTYIRPIQKNLELTQVIELPGGATEKCLKCGQIYGLEQLASHLDVCDVNIRCEVSTIISTTNTATPLFLPQVVFIRQFPINVHRFRVQRRLSLAFLKPLDSMLLSMHEHFSVNRAHSVVTVFKTGIHIYLDCRSTEDNLIDLTDGSSNSFESVDDDSDLPPAPTAHSSLYYSSHDDVTENQSIEDEMVGVAIGDSLSSSDSPHRPGISADVKNETALVDEIKSLQKNIDYDSSLRIEVRRNFVLSDALREARKNKFNPKKFIKVNFVGEGSIDHGGPKREFFRLLAEQACTYFRGDDRQPKFLRNNILAVQKNDFFNMGVYCVLSIIYGGKGYPFLAEPVFEYLATGKYSITIPEVDIPDALLKLVVTKLRCAESNNDVCEIFALDEATELLYSTGYSKPTSSITLKDRDELSSVLLDYHLMAKVKMEMDQFKAGLGTFNFIEQLKSNPAMWRSYFVATNIKLSAESIKGLLDVQYSDKDSSLRPKEEEAYIFFADFLDECEENEHECCLQDVLVFFSGTDTIPPYDFNPTITFLHGAVLPTASTCDLEFRIPTSHTDYLKFRDAMVLGLKGNDGFGGP